MLVGIPVIFTSLKSSKAYLVKANTIKLDFPVDPKIISRKILYLSGKKKMQPEISIKSKTLIEEKLNWKNESAK